MADQNNLPNNQPSERQVKDQFALLTFIEDIIKERKDPNITDQNLPKIKEMLLEELNDSINRHMISLISEKDQLLLDEMLEKNISDDEVDTFFRRVIPNFEAEIAAVLLKFRAGYLYPVKDRILQEKKQSESLISASDIKPPEIQKETFPGFPPPAPVPKDKVN